MVTRDILFLYLARIFLLFLGFLTDIGISHTAGLTEKGLFFQLVSAATMIAFFSTLGLDYKVIKNSEDHKSQSKISYTLCEVTWIFIFSLLIALFYMFTVAYKQVIPFWVFFPVLFLLVMVESFFSIGLYAVTYFKGSLSSFFYRASRRLFFLLFLGGCFLVIDVNWHVLVLGIILSVLFSLFISRDSFDLSIQRCCDFSPINSLFVNKILEFLLLRAWYFVAPYFLGVEYLGILSVLVLFYESMLFFPQSIVMAHVANGALSPNISFAKTIGYIFILISQSLIVFLILPLVVKWLYPGDFYEVLLHAGSIAILGFLSGFVSIFLYWYLKNEQVNPLYLLFFAVVSFAASLFIAGGDGISDLVNMATYNLILIMFLASLFFRKIYFS